MNLPLVSIIIPCRNEERFIAFCLDSIIKQNYPKDKLEILVVDGMSEDKTRDIIKEYTKRHFFIRLLDNPKRIFATANNIGIKNAKGEFIIIFGSHARYSFDYIQKCVDFLEKHNDLDAVGGVLKAMPSNNSLIAKAIVLSLGGRFGKWKKDKNLDLPYEADTVFGICFRRTLIDRIGGFNENLIGSSDMDFSLRIKKAGGKIYVLPSIKSIYYPKDKLIEFFKHNIRDGIWAILPLKYTKRLMKPRHYLPLIFILTLPLSIFPYILCSLYFSLRISLQEKNWKYFFVMPIVFAVRHFGYGLGSLWGVIRLIF